MNKILFKTLFPILIIVAFVACKKTEPGIGIGKSKDAVLGINFTMPMTFASTKTLVAEEVGMNIKDVFVFFFKQEGDVKSLKKDKLHYVVKGNNVTTTEGVTNLDAKFYIKDNNLWNNDFYCYVITNIEDFMTAEKFESFTDQTYEQLYDLLQRTFDKDDKNLIMWGESSATFQPLMTTDISLKLLRSVARIDVGVGQYEAGTWSNPNNIDLLLKSIHIFKPNTDMSFMPSVNAKPGDDDAKKVTVPSDIDGQKDIDDPTNYPVQATDINTNNYFENIYIPESDVILTDAEVGNEYHLNRCAIVVGGSYKTNDISYYRIDFKTPGVTPGEVMNILRNHLYRVVITDVRGNGFATEEQAYRSKKTSITADIVSWEEKEQDIIFDGIDWLSIEKKSILLPGEKDVLGYIAISSSIDVGNWEMSLTPAGVIDPDVDNTIENVDFSVTKPLKSEGGKLTIKALNTLTTTDLKEASLTIRAGRLTFTVAISQLLDGVDDWETGEDFDPDF